jgi:hypothetical protein
MAPNATKAAATARAFFLMSELQLILRRRGSEHRFGRVRLSVQEPRDDDGRGFRQDDRSREPEGAAPPARLADAGSARHGLELHLAILG